MKKTNSKWIGVIIFAIALIVLSHTAFAQTQSNPIFCSLADSPNISDVFDSRAFIIMTGDFNQDLEMIETAIANNEWEKRLEFIRYEKKRILEKMNAIVRIEREIVTITK